MLPYLENHLDGGKLRLGWVSCVGVMVAKAILESAAFRFCSESCALF